MNHQRVKSSIIESVAHEASTKKLHVKFKNGTVYEYDNVPIAKYLALITSPSVGSYLTNHITGQHKHKKLIF